MVYQQKSGLNDKISKSTKQSNETRWNTTILMLQSFERKQWNKIDSNQVERFSCIDSSTVKCSGELLQPFYNATKLLNTGENGTRHIMHTYVREAIEILYVQGFLKPERWDHYEKNFKIVPFHKIALFVSPKFKSLVTFDIHERMKVIDLVNNFQHHCFQLPAENT